MLLLLAVVGWLLASPTVAAAQEGSDDGGGEPRVTWGVVPSSPDGPDGRPWFDYTLDRGEVVRDYVGISNFTYQPLTLSVYASDAFTTPDGGFDLLPASEPPTSIGAWVEFGSDSVNVPPRSRLDVPFRLTVAEDARPGDFAGGIVTSVRTEQVDASGNRVAIDARVGARIYLRVNGQLDPALEVGAIEATYHPDRYPLTREQVVVTYAVRNPGNARLTGRPIVTVSGPFGWGKQTVEADQLPELLPGEVFRQTVVVDGVWPLVRLRAEVRLEPTFPDPRVGDPVPVATSAETAVWAVPWTTLALLVVLATALVWRRRRRKQRRRRGGDHHPPDAPTGEDGRVSATKGLEYDSDRSRPAPTSLR